MPGSQGCSCCNDKSKPNTWPQGASAAKAVDECCRPQIVPDECLKLSAGVTPTDNPAVIDVAGAIGVLPDEIAVETSGRYTMPKDLDSMQKIEDAIGDELAKLSVLFDERRQ